MRTVLVEINGGLGNQLFQFAAGYAMAKKLDCKLVLDLSWFGQSTANRKFELASLPLQVEHVAGHEAELLRKQILQHDLFGTAARYLPFGQRIFSRSRKHAIFETSIAYDPQVEMVSAPVWMRGHFVTERYFKSAAPELRTALRDFGAGIGLLPKKQLREDSLVAVHVRLTDYVTPKYSAKFSGSCDPSYYRRAFQVMQKFMPGCAFHVFSDDPQGASKLLTGLEVAKFVDNAGASPWCDLFEMSAYRHNIIANSTYSWWAAWLNFNLGKTVIAPRHWFARAYTRKKDCGDVLPPDWLTLESDSYGF